MTAPGAVPFGDNDPQDAQDVDLPPMRGKKDVPSNDPLQVSLAAGRGDALDPTAGAGAGTVRMHHLLSLGNLRPTPPVWSPAPPKE